MCKFFMVTRTSCISWLPFVDAWCRRCLIVLRYTATIASSRFNAVHLLSVTLLHPLFNRLLSLHVFQFHFYSHAHSDSHILSLVLSLVLCLVHSFFLSIFRTFILSLLAFLHAHAHDRFTGFRRIIILAILLVFLTFSLFKSIAY